MWPKGQSCLSRSPRPHCSRPCVSVGKNGEGWPFACHSRGSHGTHASTENPPMCAQATLPPVAASGASTCTSSPQALASGAPPHCHVRRTTTSSGSVETRQEFSFEMHGPAAIRGPRCWHLRPRKHSWPSASRPYFFRDVINAWLKIEVLLRQRPLTHLWSNCKQKRAPGGYLLGFLLLRLWKFGMKSFTVFVHTICSYFSEAISQEGKHGQP